MKIIIICLGDIRQYPPALSVYNCLKHLGHEVVVFTDDGLHDYNGLKEVCGKNVISANVDYFKKRSLLIKLMMYVKLKKQIKNLIEKEYEENSLIWFIGNDSIKYIGDYLEGKNYILHFLELTSSICLSQKFKLFPVDIKKYCDNAMQVIACEENRSFIMQVKWQLKHLPVVIPNKLFLERSFDKKSAINNEAAEKIIRKLSNKKIILYQGILSQERPLDEFMKAMDIVGDDFVFVIMSSCAKPENLECYKNCYFIPYVAAPYHLQITSHAYIGVLSYLAAGGFYESLNAIYCAPNKLYEYSGFCVPMIGNKIPGLLYPFEKYQMGECVDLKDSDIAKAILKIDSSYEKYAKHAFQFYNSIDLNNFIQKNILDKAKNGESIENYFK